MIDVLVIGGGNAALCAALMAREAGASVMLLEASPKIWRGGNSQHTRNLRCMHDAPQDVLVDAYPEEEYWQDLLKVTGGLTDEKLARIAIRASSSCRDWMRSHGVHFQPSLSGALHVARTNAFFMGGGKALINAYFRSAERLGIHIRYNAPVTDIELDGGKFVAAWKWHATKTRGQCAVAAVLGIECNLELGEHRCVFWIGAHKLVETLALHDCLFEDATDVESEATNIAHCTKQGCRGRWIRHRCNIVRHLCP